MNTIYDRIKNLLLTVRKGIERFPLTVAFAVVLTGCMMFLEYKGYNYPDEKWRFFLFWYPSTGLLLSLSLSLWLEEHAGKWGYKVVAGLIHLAWIGVSVLLMCNYKMTVYAPYKYVMMALIAALIVSLLVLSFFKNKTDVAFWNFSLRSVGAVATAIVVSGIVCGGLELLIVAIDKLFGVFVSSHWYSNVAILCFCLLAPILVIQGIPGGTLKHDDEPILMPGLIENAVTKLFMPIAAAYLVTLYCYAAKILFTWQLPDGWVSWLVTASMAAMVILFMMVYPYIDKASQSTSGWNRMAVRFITDRMPLLMLPLLLLMSIGIARRISDYGITILRVYLVAFNLWCYAVCIILIIKRRAGIMWIPVSLVLTFAVLTLLPVNVSTCVRKNLTNKVNAILQENGWNGAAMSDDEYGKFLSKLDSSVSHQLDSRIDYLKSQFSRQSASKMCLYEYNTDLKKNCIKDEILTVELPVEFDYNRSSRTLKYEFHIPLSQLRALEEEMTPDNIIKDDFNHVVSLTGTLVGTSANDTPAKVTLFLDTFHLRHDGKEGYIRVTGPLFF